MTVDNTMKAFFEAENSLHLIKSVMSGKDRFRGDQARLSEYIACNPSHISKVLKGDAILSPEQAAGVAEFWQLGELQSLVFLTLIHLDRAGTQRLRTLLKRNLSFIRERMRNELPMPPYML